MIISRPKISIFILFIFAVIFFAGNFDFPQFWNRAAESFKFQVSGFKFQQPHFPEIPFRLGLDLQGGTHLIYETDLSSIGGEDWEDSLQGLRDVIERRVNLFGVQEPVVQIEKKSRRLIVELAGVKDISQAVEMIGQTPYLEFKEERPSEETQKIIDKQKEIEGKNPEEFQQVADWYLAFEDPYFQTTQLTGKYLKRSQVQFDSQTSKSEIGLEFNDEGAKIFEELTKINVGKRLAIYIDNVLLSAPTVQEVISGGQARITGDFTIQEARDLSRNLNAGALPVPIKLISQETVGASLGEASLVRSLRAGIIGFLAVILFMVLVYKLQGFLAALSLSLYVVLILFLFKVIPVTLTLAGIAGFVLSIGMAVDANVLIFARMKEELRQGKSFGLALEEGFRRAWPSIRDSNLTTLLTSMILFGFGTSFVKGFALTLSIGILMSMFSALVITKLFLKWFVGTRFEKWGWLWIG